MKRMAKALTARSAYRGRFIEVAVETVELPNGNRAELEIVRHPGAAVIVPLDADGRVVLVRQYRHAAAGWLLEAPAAAPEGMVPQPAAGIDAAKPTGVAALVPPDWSGTGILERRADAPKGAPPWAQVVAEVIDDGGKRWLRASGVCDKLKNKALA